MIGKPRILVVDDEVPIQELLKTRLKKLYEIECATYQDEAFAALGASRFDLVLLDLKLPRHRRDLKPSPEVGVDILQQIRERGICRRDTPSPLPIIVMTAFGGDKLLSAAFLQHRGVCDYVQKPFGDGKVLAKKIEAALCNEGMFSAPSNNTLRVVQLRFNEKERRVLVENCNYVGAHYELLDALRVPFMSDLATLKAHENFEGRDAKALGALWGIEHDAARKRVYAFRKRVLVDFRDKMNRILDENDVVENLRDWRGYRLNPLVVKIVGWGQ